MPALIGTSGSFVGIVFDLAEDEISIGRLEDNLIVVDDASVSGNHAVLSRQSNGWLLEDLQSTNGTKVNGQPVGETLLQEQDEVQFGAIKLVYTETNPNRFDLNKFTEPDKPIPSATAKPAHAPTVFSAQSPFQAPNNQKEGLWNTILLVIGIVAMVGVGILFYVLFVTT